MILSCGYHLGPRVIKHHCHCYQSRNHLTGSHSAFVVDQTYCTVLSARIKSNLIKFSSDSVMFRQYTSLYIIGHLHLMLKWCCCLVVVDSMNPHEACHAGVPGFQAANSPPIHLWLNQASSWSTVVYRPSTTSHLSLIIRVVITFLAATRCVFTLV